MGRPKKQAVEVVEVEAEIFTATDDVLAVPDREDEAVAPDPDHGRDEIYKKYDEQRNAEAGVATQEASLEEPDAPQEVAIVVNGRERMVLKSKVEDAGGVAAYQKNAAASETLNQAKEYERTVNAKAIELQAYERQLTAERNNFAAEKASVPNQAERKDLADKYNEALINGEMDQASELLLKLQGAQGATPVDVQAILAQAVRVAKQELTNDHQKKAAVLFRNEQDIALQKYFEKDTDISGDPRLSNMADAETITIQTAHPEWGAGRIIEEATKNVRAWVSTKFSVAPDKLSAKRSIDTVVGGSARATVRPTPKPQSGSDYINALRKQRGLE